MNALNPYALALAGLLHDIGKFALRAEVGASRSWPDARSEYAYKHALLSADFVKNYVPQAWQETVLEAGGYHHQPQTDLDRIVTLADRLSAGERAAPPDRDDSARRDHPRQLLSIFNTLVSPDGQRAPTPRYLPLQPLQLTRETLFPGPPLTDEADVWRAYTDLWKAFCGEAQQLHNAHAAGNDLEVYLESLLLLLQRYTWCISSAYFNATPDISLYDHSRMTAALAAVLSRVEWASDQLRDLVQHPDGDNPIALLDHPIALLVGGDISGVQDFIYTITARGATSALRGRSFYLQLLTEATARYVLRRLDLPVTNLIYAGGGKFYLLAAPNHVDALAAIQREISQVLLRHHQGVLYLALVHQPLAGRDFYDQRFAAAWDDLHTRFQPAKLRRFGELGDDLSYLFAPAGAGNADQLCKVCGQEHPNTREDRRPDDSPDDPTRKCPPCLAFEELGKDLRAARYLCLEQASPTSTPLIGERGDYRAVLAGLGLKVVVSDDIPASGSSRQTLLALRDDALDALIPSATRAIGRRLLVNVTPRLEQTEVNRYQPLTSDPLKTGDIKPYSVLARQSQGIARLGVLRMDVDGLGKLFAGGLGKHTSLSHMASLSFAISLYFEGWVGVLAEQKWPNHAGEQQRIYAIYSGGDDLFFVGAWDAVVELARRIRADLTPYAASHPGVTISAGLALVTDKYPLYQAAEDAGQAEKAAKAYTRPQTGRRADAIAFLGAVVPWEQFGFEDSPDDFLAHAADLAHFLAAETPDRRPLIRRLLALYAQYAEAEDKRRRTGRDRNRAGQPQPLYGPWMYRAAYTLTRLANQREEDQNAITALRDRLHRDQFQTMPWIGLAARWADLLSRKADQE